MSPPSRVQTDPRISRRRKAVARSKRRRLAVWSAGVAGLGALGWTAFFSPLLAVDRVAVVGGRHTTSAQVAEAAGLDRGDNLLLLSTTEVARAAQTLPWVKLAQVDRMLPGTVRVRIVERRPAVVLSLGVARWTLDARGHVLASGEVADVPVLGGVETGGIRPGIVVDTPEVAHALRAFRRLPSRLHARVVAIVAPTLERISFSLSDGTLIRYGAAERMEAKNEVLSALLERLAQEGRTAAYIDVRVPTSPAVAPATMSIPVAAATPAR